MNLATLVQSQTLATLLQALTPATGLAAGGTVEARLLAIAGDGTATAEIGDTKISLVLAGPEARQAALTSGATLLLKLVPPEQPGAALRATLMEVRPATATAAPASSNVAPATANAAPAAMQTTAPPSVAAQMAAPLPSPTTLTPASVQITLAGSPGPHVAAANPTALGAVQTPARGGASAIATPSRASMQATGAAASTSQQAVPQRPDALATANLRASAGPLLGAALANQDGLAPLLANLRAIAGSAVGLSVPAPVLKLADQILAQALPVERRAVTPEALKQAVQRSGLFMEAHQASGQPPSSQPDLKAGLVALRDTLAPMLARLGALPLDKGRIENTGPQPGEPARPAPPHRDGALSPQPIAEPTLMAADKPLGITETLLRQTEAALDRITLSQYASLPLEPARADASPAQRWLTEIPLAFQAGTAILPLQVEREPPRRHAADAGEGPLWRVRFALDVEPMGPLQGVVTLQGRSVGVSLWAEREDTSRLLRGAAPGLEAALIDAQFENSAIDIHTGQPRVMQATAGQFLDRLS